MQLITLGIIPLIASTTAFAEAPEPIGRWWSQTYESRDYENGYTVQYMAQSDYSDRGNKIVISCAFLNGDTTGVSFFVGGELPAGDSSVRVIIDGQRLDLTMSPGGTFMPLDQAEDAQFRALWHMIRKGTKMQVRFANGQSGYISLTGSAKTMPSRPCPTDFTK